MHREQAAEKLHRIIQTIETRPMPIKVRQVYVFGSYARGALNCGDLDLVIITDKPTDDDDRRCRERMYMGFPDYGKAFRKRLKSAPSERVQILLATSSLDQGIRWMKFKPEECVLVWDGDDKWRQRIAAIKPDIHAGPADRRRYMFDGEGFAWEEERYWQWAEDGIRTGAIVLTRIAVKDLPERAWPRVSRRLQYNFVSTKMAALMNTAISFITQANRKPDWNWFGQPWLLNSKGKSIRFYLGKPRVSYINAWLCDDRVTKACALPFLRRTKPNAIWVFARGGNFKAYRAASDIYRRS